MSAARSLQAGDDYCLYRHGWVVDPSASDCMCDPRGAVVICAEWVDSSGGTVPADGFHDRCARCGHAEWKHLAARFVLDGVA